MRKIILFLVLVAVSILVNAQIDRTFNKVFFGTSFDTGIETLRLSNGEYRVIANTGSYGQGSADIWVIALDTNADFAWQKTYGGTGDDIVYDAIIDSADNIYMVGYSGSSSVSDYDLLFLSIDKNGVPITEKYFGGNDWDFGKRIAKLNDTTFYLAGETYSFGLGYSKLWVLRVNKNGHYLSSQIISDTFDLKVADIGISKDGEILVCGSGKIDSILSTKPFIARFDTNLTLSYQNYFPDSNGLEFKSITLNADNTMLLVGKYLNDTANFTDPLTLLLDQDCNLIWNRSQSQGGDAWFNEVDTFNGSYFITGVSKVYTTGQEDFYFARFSSGAYWQAGSVHGDTKYDEPSSINFYPKDSTILTTGTTKGFNVPGSGILVCQRDWNFTGNNTVEIIVVSGMEENYPRCSKYKVYPVPANDYLNIERDLANSSVDISIANLEGRIIKSLVMKNNQKSLRINLEALPSGLYLLTVENNSIKFVKK